MGGNGDRAGNLFKKFSFEGQLVVLRNPRINSAHQPRVLSWLECVGGNHYFQMKTNKHYPCCGVVESQRGVEGGDKKTRFVLKVERYLSASHCPDPFTFMISCSSLSDPVRYVSRMFFMSQRSKLRLQN